MQYVKRFLTGQINNLWFILTYLLLLIVLLFPYYTISALPSAGIDNSWRIALEIAYQKGMVFGKDIIYTYGPLGRLTQRVSIATSNFEFFLYDIFCFANVGFFLYHLLPKPLKVYQLIIHFAVFLLISAIYGEWLSFLLFYISIFSGLLFLKKSNHWFLIHAILMGMINFYIKANYGVIALGFVFLLLFYAFFSKRLSLKNLLFYSFGSLIALILLAFLLKTDLVAYFWGSIEIIKGYNESQSFFPNNRLMAVVSSYGVFIAFLFVFMFFSVQVFRKKLYSLPTLDSFFVLGCVGVCTFVLLKYAFVRADDGHLMSFVRSASLPFLLLCFFSTDTWLRRSGWALIAINFLSYYFFYQPIYGKLSFSIADNLRTKSYIFPQYYKDIAQENTTNYKPNYPADVLKIIGNKTVDLIPNETSEIYLNKLNYNPRPVIQSYQAYNEYLDKKNQEKYLSATAPDFVVYSIESTDNKYAVGDETLTFLALLQRYEPIRIWENHLLLRKKNTYKTLKLIKQTSHTWSLGKDFRLDSMDGADSLKKHQFSVIKIKTTYNLLGKLLNLLFQPPHLNMHLTTENGKNTIYRTVPIILSKGLIINTKLDSVSEVKTFFEQNSVANKAIRSIKLEEIVRRRAGFNTKIEIVDELYELK